jgi:hypothetical protein
VTLPRLRALYAHWRRHPRPEWLIAGYLKYKPPREADLAARATSQSDRESSAAAMAAAFGLAGGGKIVQ